jgi:phage I-like protein
MIGAGTFAPERVAAAEVDPELVMMVIEDIAGRSELEAQVGIELFATCAAAYADYMGIEATPGEDAFEEEEIVVIAALASRVTALSKLTEAGHLDHKMSPAAEEGMVAVAVAASRATLLHRDGLPTFQLLEFLNQLQRAEQEGAPW